MIYRSDTTYFLLGNPFHWNEINHQEYLWSDHSRLQWNVTDTLWWSLLQSCSPGIGTVDGRNPANQLRLVVYPIIYKVLYIPGGDRRIAAINSIMSPKTFSCRSPKQVLNFVVGHWEAQGTDGKLQFAASHSWKGPAFAQGWRWRNQIGHYPW